MNIIAPRFIVVALLAALLSGCSNAPSDAQMQEALLNVMRPVTGASTTIQSFEARDCEGFDNGVYRCNVKAKMHYTVKFGGRSQDKTQPFVGMYDFIEKPDGWKLVN